MANNFTKIDSVELEGTKELLRHAVAHVLGKTYPWFFCSGFIIDKLFLRKILQGDRMNDFCNVLSPIVDIRLDVLSETRSIETLALTLLPSLNHPYSEKMRIYIALSQGYNFLRNNGFLVGAEWISPWEQWRYYVVNPIYESDECFLLFCSCFGHVPENVLEKIASGKDRSLVMDTLSLIFEKYKDECATKSQSGRWEIDSDVSRWCNVAGFADAAMRYVTTGVRLWNRDWRGYYLETGP